jgi:hypothetical protein
VTQWYILTYYSVARTYEVVFTGAFMGASHGEQAVISRSAATAASVIAFLSDFMPSYENVFNTECPL